MGFYSNHIFPHLMDRALSRRQVMSIRKEALAHVSGRTLEIGFGTGLNVSCYPNIVQEITAVDPNSHMRRLANRRIRDSRICVDFQILSAEKMPFPSEVFDTVVSTWTLCSIPGIQQALVEVHRVLKRNGRLVFLEHGRSPDKSVQIWQRAFRPLFKVAGAGCRLDREISSLIEGQGFVFDKLKCFYLEATPRIAGYIYTGVAAKH
ncbi:MAG TPA: class I SAM-dependent methyltransferase [Terriglobia bacterium]|nr:class I SAM-dependent methyltransferase [Terriglobia bacterium]